MDRDPDRGPGGSDLVRVPVRAAARAGIPRVPRRLRERHSYGRRSRPFSADGAEPTAAGSSVVHRRFHRGVRHGDDPGRHVRLLLLQYANVITRIFGVVVIVLGLVFIELFGVAQRTLHPRLQSHTGLLGAPLLGFALGVGWTPCIGPTLAAILSVSWNLGDPARAGVLGLAYSLGLGLPFLILALGWGWASRSVAFLRRHIRTLNIVGGALLILLGVLMVTGLWTALMSALQQVVINVPLPL